MTKRAYCPQCQYPQSACLCAAVKPIYPQHRLLILQHPSEVTHTKNSVRLLKMAVPQTQIVVGETAADFAELRSQLQQEPQALLVYPADESSSTTTRESHSASVSEPLLDSQTKTLILIDGTWRKAYRMLCLNPWLLDLPRLSLSVENASAYCIRKAKRSDSLSTLEAAALALKQLQPNLDITPVTDLLQALVDSRLARMPAAVRQRYQAQ